ncbi:MAG TPA: hypothetical protein VF123_09550 [Candidatus Sulfotelmatobacter sp.]
MSAQIVAVEVHPRQYPSPQLKQVSRRVRRRTCRLLAHVYALVDSSTSAEFVELHNLLGQYLQQPTEARQWAETFSREQLNDQF